MTHLNAFEVGVPLHAYPSRYLLALVGLPPKNKPCLRKAATDPLGTNAARERTRGQEKTPPASDVGVPAGGCGHGHACRRHAGRHLLIDAAMRPSTYCTNLNTSPRRPRRFCPAKPAHARLSRLGTDGLDTANILHCIRRHYSRTQRSNWRHRTWSEQRAGEATHTCC